MTREIARYAPSLAGMPGYFGMSMVTFVTLLMFIGATGKSAQIPLYVWLPDAMAGPTPVSALIHAATMVTAGIYMVARLNFLFSMAPATMVVVAMVGALTALFAATIGLAQNDIKKVLAYSTISQLGYMFAAVGVGAYAAGVFHLMTHAFFKACLFLGSGSVIHAMGGEQDMRKMGGLRDHMPITFWTFLAATLAICGVPPFAGFMSKDEIIWQALAHGHQVVWALLWLGAGTHGLLHVPPGLHDLLRRVPRHPRAGASSARIAALDVDRCWSCWACCRWSAGSSMFPEFIAPIKTV